MLRRCILLILIYSIIAASAPPLASAQEPALEPITLEPITLDNANQIEELARFGNGVFTGSLAYSPDGKTLAVAGSIGLWLYDTSNFELAPRLIKRSAPVTRVAFSANGKYLVYRTTDGVYVTDFEAGTGLLFLPRATDFAIHPDNRQLAVSYGYWESNDEAGMTFFIIKLQLWDMLIQRQLQELNSNLPDEITELAFSSDGKVLATVHSEPVYDICAWHDSRVALWSFADGQLTPADGVWGSDLVAFDPNSPLLYTAEQDRYEGYTGRLRVWDVDNAQEARIEMVEGRANSIWQSGYSDLTINPDGSQLAFLRPHVLSLVDPKTLQTTQVIDEWFGMQQIAYHPHREQLVATTYTELLIWEESTTDPKVIALDHPLGKVTFNPDGFGFVASNNDELQLWAVDGINAEEIHREEGATFREFSGSKVVFESDSVLHLWDLAERRELLKFEGWTLDQPRPFSINTESSQMAVVSATNKATIEVWDLTTLRLQQEIHAENPVIALQFSPDSQRLLGQVSEGNSGVTLTLWSLEMPDYSQILRHNAPQISTLFSPDSEFIFITQALADERDEAAITYRWDLDTSLKLEVFTGENVGFLEDGAVFYSSTYTADWPGGTELITFHDSETFEEIKSIWASYSGYDSYFSAFSPNGQFLLNISSSTTNCDVNGTLFLQDVQAQTPIKTSDYYIDATFFTFSPHAPLFILPRRGALEVLSLDTGEKVSEIQTADTTFNAMEFNADGTMLMTSSADGTVRLWGVPVSGSD